MFPTLILKLIPLIKLTVEYSIHVIEGSFALEVMKFFPKT